MWTRGESQKEDGFFVFVFFISFHLPLLLFDRLVLELAEGLVADSVRIVKVPRNTMPGNIAVSPTDCAAWRPPCRCSRLHPVPRGNILRLHRCCHIGTATQEVRFSMILIAEHRIDDFNR